MIFSNSRVASVMLQYITYWTLLSKMHSVQHNVYILNTKTVAFFQSCPFNSLCSGFTTCQRITLHAEACDISQDPETNVIQLIWSFRRSQMSTFFSIIIPSWKYILKQNDQREERTSANITKYAYMSWTRIFK